MTRPMLYLQIFLCCKQSHTDILEHKFTVLMCICVSVTNRAVRVQKAEGNPLVRETSRGLTRQRQQRMSGHGVLLGHMTAEVCVCMWCVCVTHLLIYASSLKCVYDGAR